MCKIKVLNIMPEFDLAGAEVMATQLMLNYGKNNIDPICISMYNKKTNLTNQLESNGIKMYYLNKHLGLDIVALWRLFKIIAKEKPDIVHTHRYSLIYSLLPSIYCRTKGKIHTIHNQAEYEIGTVGQKIYQIAFEYLGVVPVAIAPLVQKSILKRYNIDAPLVYNGVDTQAIKSKVDYTHSNKIKFVHVGRFSYVKNHELLLHAFHKLFLKYPQIELHLIGGGELFEDIKKKVILKKLQDSVVLYGLREDVTAILSQFDVFIYPSRWEGMPMAIIEAMSCGLPIIASKVGGIPDIVKNQENGFLIESENEEELIEAMELMIRKHELIYKFGKKSLELVQNYDIRTMTTGYEKLYFALLGE